MDRGNNTGIFSGFQVHSQNQERWFWGLGPGSNNFILRNLIGNVVTVEESTPPNLLYAKAQNQSLGVRTGNPTALFQVGDPFGHPNHFGDTTTMGIWQQPGDGVGLSLRRGDGMNPIQQFCVNLCNYIEMRADNNFPDLWFGREPGLPTMGMPTMVVQRADRGANVGVGLLNPTAQLQVGDHQNHPNNFGNITTMGIWQQPNDSVGLSIRKSIGNPVQQFCNLDCNYIEMDQSTTNLMLGQGVLHVRKGNLGGGVGIHSQPIGGFSLAVNGQSMFNGPVIATAPVQAPQFIQTSSRRFKTDIETLTGALDLVGRMRGVTYTAKATGKAEVGVIAEEMYDVLPQVVAVSDGLVQGVEYSRLVAVLIEAVKEQQEQIKALRQEMTELAAALAAAAVQK